MSFSEFLNSRRSAAKELVAALKRGDHHYMIEGKIVPEILEELLP